MSKYEVTLVLTKDEFAAIHMAIMDKVQDMKDNVPPHSTLFDAPRSPVRYSKRVADMVALEEKLNEIMVAMFA